MAKVRSPAGSGLAAMPSAGGPQDGYLLIELVATLAITALLLGFVLPIVPSATGSARFVGLVTASAALLRDARSEAIMTSTAVPLRFDPRARQLGNRSRSLAIPADVDVSLVAGGNCPAGDKQGAAIVFRSDGTNCGGVLRFARRGRVMRVRVDWVDGRIDVVQGG